MEDAIVAAETALPKAKPPLDADRSSSLEARLDGSTYYTRLVHRPEPHARRQPPLVWLLRDRPSASTPAFTAVVPVFNHAHTIAGCLKRIVENASTSLDLVVVDDGSDDDTAKTVAAAVDEMRHASLGRVVLVHNPVPIFETACDNQGFVLAETDYVIEVQADITIDEPGYDERLLRPLASRADVSAVSGRFVHGYDLLAGRRGWREYPFQRFVSRFVRRDSVGLVGRKIFREPSAHRLADRYYMGETAARGPWALRSRDLREHGYLDEANFFLGFDDHDFHRRMLDHSGGLPVYAPMRISSPEADGATRRTRTGLNREVYVELESTRTGSEAFAEFLASYRPFFHSRPIGGIV